MSLHSSNHVKFKDKDKNVIIVRIVEGKKRKKRKEEI